MTMSVALASAAGQDAPLAVHLLGRVDYESCLALQDRLVYEAGGDRRGRMTLLVCEHPETITIGRHGSRAHVLLDEAELASRKLRIRWVNRGGGCLMHGPGQLAVYPIVPLGPHGWTVGDYLARLQAALDGLLDGLGVQRQPQPWRRGGWGRSGQLAVVGAAVKYGVAYHGAFVNVSPAMHLTRLVETDAVQRKPLSSLAAELQKPVKMSAVREAVIRHVSAALDAPRYHLFSGHPLLTTVRRPAPASRARVG